ncbi:3-phosphoshikimate 1-carboxyvinyltransferase [Anaerohalosphaera lusitana]|uniref:3-phosphoshikimate 1-carboxyvinyltransferase n=1 Tax=Anaerohalosphaera lusitana TaxID=1936003 RepID=A0A1U9NQZ7_9BACT|nr:3-phosphoshikimate 1-carboxyvinyltransferase [Anaerohalosphaera lusitana]AQT70245.1 3-phosphoshikimate 1-carboxyvinyltransferase [Anaerohalosphaera lusitana]
MNLICNKSRIKGRVPVPASKSHTIRAVAVASLAHGRSIIQKPLVSSDTLSSVECYRKLGAEIDTSSNDAWIVDGTEGRIPVSSARIDVGNSGTTLRLAISSAALADEGTFYFTGDKQIRSRPIQPLLGALNDLGARAESVNGDGKAPLEVTGTLRGGKTHIECPTSQYLSSLLMAAPLAGGETEIEVGLLNEPDYVRMTLDWLDRQGINYENDNMKRFHITGGQRYSAFEGRVAADFSSATFLLCAGAILDADILLTGLDFSDSQPDKAVVDYLRKMGADITVGPEGVAVRNSRLRGVEIDMNGTPDALPAMAVTAAFAEGETRLVNVPQARNKETDRIDCMARELAKMGASVEQLPDGLIIRGGGVRAAQVDGHHDHRIVMALAMAGMAVEGETVITTAEAMNVTFPDFVTLMDRLGANLRLEG